MNIHDEAFAGLVVDSYAKLVGRPLVPYGVTSVAAWLYEASFGLLAHDASPDPVFVYANRTAQDHFEYGWHEFVGLPSRLSAGADDREERRLMLDSVRSKGYADGYRGMRVAKSGRRFWIDDTSVWNLVGPDGAAVGQAAMIRRWDGI